MIGCRRKARLTSRRVFDLVMVVSLTAGLVPAQVGPAEAQVRAVPRTGGNAILSRLKLTVNKSQTVKVDSAFADVLVGSSDIADVVPISDRTLYVLGKRAGTTNVSLIDSERKLVGLIDVEVRPDTGVIESQVRQSTGDSGLRVESQGERVILGGVAGDAVSVDRAMQVAPPGTLNLSGCARPSR